MQEYTRNWRNIDLESPCERDLKLIEALSFEMLLLEIHCNLPEINEATVTQQFEDDLHRIVQSAREVFQDNLPNIVKYALKQRNIP